MYELMTGAWTRSFKLAAISLAFVVAVASAGCSQGRSAPPPPVDDTTRTVPPSAPKAEAQGMSGRQKLVILAGAAALYYLYKKHQNAAAQTGENGQYYLSKNGRVYYRDADHRAHWVTPPPGGISVPEGDAAPLREFQGYDNRPTGKDLTGLGSDTTN